MAITCTAPVNIAVVKYWGKQDEDLILPLNSSLSITLSQDQLRAKTTIKTSPDFAEDKFVLNGREESMNNPRIQKILKQVGYNVASKGDVFAIEALSWKIHITSENNFPTAAGLASSAAGYACLAFALAKLFKMEGDISTVARLGSGSACRSIYGGFVVWDKGTLACGSDSVARQIAPHTHWPEFRALILVVSDHAKHTGSSDGMQKTVQTSELLAERIRSVEKRIGILSQAILNKDFHMFAEQTMKESNQLHAVCLDTYPPITYLTDISHTIILLVHAYNTFCGENKVAYTFDAGPNACLYLLEQDLSIVIALILHFFPPLDNKDFVKGLPVTSTNLGQVCMELSIGCYNKNYTVFCCLLT